METKQGMLNSNKKRMPLRAFKFTTIYPTYSIDLTDRLTKKSNLNCMID